MMGILCERCGETIPDDIIHRHLADGFVFHGTAAKWLQLCLFLGIQFNHQLETAYKKP